jgi:hypothetical protein
MWLQNYFRQDIEARLNIGVMQVISTRSAGRFDAMRSSFRACNVNKELKLRPAE